MTAATKLPIEGRRQEWDTSLIDDAQKEHYTYKKEQERLNTQVYTALVSAEKQCVANGESLKRIVGDHFQCLLTELLPHLETAIEEFTAMYQWPVVGSDNIEKREHASVTTTQSVALDQQKSAINSGMPFKIPDELTLKSSVPEDWKFHLGLTENLKIIPAGSRCLKNALVPDQGDALFEKITLTVGALNAFLLHDNNGDIVEKLFVRTRQLQQTGTKAQEEIQRELLGRRKQLLGFWKKLAEVSHKKEQCLRQGDINGTSDASYEELKVLETIMSYIRDALKYLLKKSNNNLEFLADRDKALKEADLLLEQFKNGNEQQHDYVKNDKKELSKLIEEKKKVEEANRESHAEFSKENNRKMEAILAEQNEVYKKMAELSQKNITLMHTYDQLFRAHVEEHIIDSRRRAYHEAWLQEAKETSNVLDSADEALEKGAKWLEELNDFKRKFEDILNSIEVGKVVDNAIIEEELDYLETYRAYRCLHDVMTERLELRKKTNEKVSRVLQLQLDERHETLDPNEKQYSSQIKHFESDIEGQIFYLNKLNKHLEFEAKHWKSVEEALLKSNIDFDPPDTSADVIKCDRKGEILERARKHVGTEIELMSRDMIELKKLRTQTKAAQEEHRKLSVHLRDMENQQKVDSMKFLDKE